MTFRPPRSLLTGFTAVLSLLAACSDNPNAQKKDLVANPDAAAMMARDDDGDGYPASDDCDDLDAAVNPGATERCDDIDNDCDGDIDDDDSWHVDNTWAPDIDIDGYPDDNGVVMACDVTSLADFVDATGGDSDMLASWIQPTIYEDTDGDGYDDMPVWDCDDADPTSNPGATEVCDGADNNCDGDIDEGTPGESTWYADADGDAYGDPDNSTDACTQPTGYVADATDCDDGAMAVNPGATEMCNDIDDDCDLLVDDDDGSVTGQTTWHYDMDSDGYGGTAGTLTMCDQPLGYVASSDDCDDTVATTYPGADETCNDVDDDCDGTIDDNATDTTTWYRDYDLDGYGRLAGAFNACDNPTSGTTVYVSQDSDCDDTVASTNPGAAEVYDGVDNDCDEIIDDGVTCVDELDYDNDVGGEVTAFEVTGTPGGTYDGDLVMGVTGWSYSSANFGGVWLATGTNNSFCIGASDTLLVDVTLSDGTSGCELGGPAEGDLLALQDGVELDSAALDIDDDGDGTYDRCVIALTLP